MTTVPNYLFIHIVTHETLICAPSELPDYVPLLKQRYDEDYSSEYENLGEIVFGSSSISLKGGFNRIVIPTNLNVTNVNGTFFIEEVKVPWHKKVLELL